MSGYRCPQCAGRTDIFAVGGGEMLADAYQIPLLGKIPLDPALTALIERDPTGPTEPLPLATETPEVDRATVATATTAPQNWDLPEKYTKCALYPLFKEIVQKIIG
ncbi:hypothetical protein PORY_002485 [Pneumocystis oryctolagi]|uniref:Uncharacterized protein n=1 Tax=Pneumocystis oryctolagi TaxID=42067 RepID=A0ACB7C9D4_9ASCO|nr:hypothetical protein PORY_002485 [Pneumocystis oryctolagi]